MKRLENKIAVITGGNGGIGLAAARLFAAHGAHVYITGRKQEALDAAAREIGSNVTTVKGNVSNMADLDHLIGEIKTAHGRIDILFSNVGTAHFEPLGHIPRNLLMNSSQPM